MPDFFEGSPPPPGPLTPMQMPQARPQWQHANIGGITAFNPSVDQNQPAAIDQELAHNSTDMEMRLNDLQKAVAAHKARGNNTGTLDKAIGIGLGVYYGQDPTNPELAQKAQSLREHRGYTHGITGDRDQIFTNAASTRQAIQAWIISASKSRNWRAVSDVQEHLPNSTDTDELLLEKLDFWRNRLAEVRGQLGGRGIPVQRPGPPGGEMPPSSVVPSGPPSSSSPSSAPLSSGISAPSGAMYAGHPPPFEVKARVGTSLEDMRLLDKNNKWHYFDKDTKGWMEFGG